LSCNFESEKIREIIQRNTTKKTIRKVRMSAEKEELSVILEASNELVSK
jgi:hypothetical protein